MIHFETIDAATFLNEYWQKKPLVIRQALPDFISPLSADELAGLALEEDVESRMVFETPGKTSQWQLKRGPFTEKSFQDLPKSHWTLLVQGVDKLVPEVADALHHFDFIPQWRIDDVMVSYAAKEGSVGPHYDNYDVFLYQAHGQRKWSLTTKNCNLGNALKDTALRIMATFDVEEEYILSPGDMLYLPPHVGHHGVSLDNDCMTYSFGYRSYQGQELWESLGDYLSERGAFRALYQDPNWAKMSAPSVLPPEASQKAKQLLMNILEDEHVLQSWFGCFATQLDSQSEQYMALPIEEEHWGNPSLFVKALLNDAGLRRDAACRFAYQENSEKDGLQLFINGCEWETEGVSKELIKHVANHRLMSVNELIPFLNDEKNQVFLHDLWKLQWLQFINE